MISITIFFIVCSVLSLISLYISSIEAFSYTSFQPQLIKCESESDMIYPVNLLALQGIVKHAIESNRTVKPTGSLHSATDIICTTGIPVGMKHIAHFSYDKAGYTATVGTGMKLLDLLEKLHQVDRTIEAVPTYGDITIGGALGSGSHGSGLDHPVTVSDLVVGVVVVDGLGNVRHITDPGTLRAFRTNLGLLGIIYEITVKTVPQFKLKIEHRLVRDGILWENKSANVIQLAKSFYRFQIWWFPTDHNVVLSLGSKKDLRAKGNCKTNFLPEVPLGISWASQWLFELTQARRLNLNMILLQSISLFSLVRTVPVRTSIFSDDEKVGLNNPCIPVAIGYSHRMQANRCKVCAWDHGNNSMLTQEFAIAVPLDEFGGAVRTIRDIFQTFAMELPLNGLFIRFLPKSDGLLNINADWNGAVVFEWVLFNRQNRYTKGTLQMPGSQALMQALIFKHHGRPHWGKNGLFYFNRDIISKRYPNFGKFTGYMNEFDPNGIFLNDFGRRLLGKSSKTPLDKFAKHCALIDNCICSSDEQCSSLENLGGWGNMRPYVCRTLRGFRVCQPNEY